MKKKNDLAYFSKVQITESKVSKFWFVYAGGVKPRILINPGDC